jgi:hypothetical protein
VVFINKLFEDIKMAKKETAVDQTQEQTVDQTEVVVHIPNIVHGLDFGSKTKVKTQRDGKVINFLFVDGSKTELNADELSPEVLAEAVLYGLEAKIKASLASKPTVEEVVSEVTKQVESFKAGTFYMRSVSSAPATLTLELEAFARVKATQPDYSHWVNVTEQSVIDEVLAFWAELTRSDKNRVNRNSTVMAMVVQLKAERGITDQIDF